MKIRTLTFVLAFFYASPVWAQQAGPLLSRFQLAQCRASETPAHSAIPGDVLAETWRQRFNAGPLADRSLGQSAVEAQRNCPGGACTDARTRALAQLYYEVRTYFIRETLPANNQFRFHRPGGRLDSAAVGEATIDAAIASAIDGRTQDLVLECIDRAAPRTPAEQRTSGWQRFISHLVIGKTSQDASRPLAKREFGTVAFTEDRGKERESLVMDVFLGYEAAHWTHGDNFGWVTPFVSIEHTDIEQESAATGERDDLTFGVTAPIFITQDDRLNHIVALSLEYETDSDFRSELTRASVAYTPYFLRDSVRCLDWYWSAELPLRCSLRVVADYADVGDPGEKESLADVREYGRLGLDLSLDYDISLENGSVLDDGPLLSIGIGYERREAWTDRGDADLISAEIAYLPSATSHFSFAIEYRQGEDLTSLQNLETTMVRLGYRR